MNKGFWIKVIKTELKSFRIQLQLRTQSLPLFLRARDLLSLPKNDKARVPIYFLVSNLK